MVPAVLGVPDPIFDVVLTVAWLIVLGGTLYRYQRGSLSHARLYGLLSGSLLWLSYSVFQLSDTVTGVAAIVVEVVGIGLFCAGIVVSLKWWRRRNNETTDGTTS